MTGYAFLGFDHRDGRLLARFGAEDGDVRVVQPGCGWWLPECESEEPHPDPRVHAELLARARELVALARTAHLVEQHDRACRPNRRRRTA